MGQKTAWFVVPFRVGEDALLRAVASLGDELAVAFRTDLGGKKHRWFSILGPELDPGAAIEALTRATGTLGFAFADETTGDEWVLEHSVIDGALDTDIADGALDEAIRERWGATDARRFRGPTRERVVDAASGEPCPDDDLPWAIDPWEAADVVFSREE